MNKRVNLILLFLCIILVVFVVINIDFNENKDVAINSLDEEYYYGEEIIYYESSELVYNSEFETYHVLNETNKYRKKQNVKSLVLDSDLSKVANIRAMEMATSGILSHKRPDGSYYSKMFKELSIKSSFSGENIAQGYTSAEDVCNAWSNSDGHYANMVKDKYNRMGVGFYIHDGVTYWVQIFSD